MLKTQKNDKDIRLFLSSIEHKPRQADAFVLLELMQEFCGEPGNMWGDSIIGFGDIRYPYDNGEMGQWFHTGFSPRKQNLSLYFMSGLEMYQNELEKLGKHKIGKSCLYINKLADVDLQVLINMIKKSRKFAAKN